MDAEGAIIAKAWEEYVLPKEQLYLDKYFSEESHACFLRYYLLVGDTKHFTSHTGCRMDFPMRTKLKNKLGLLERALAKARADGNFRTVAKIEAGDYLVTVPNVEIADDDDDYD